MEGMGDPTPLRGRTALVTGGTTGIGRATARLLARRGVRVMIFGRSDDHLEQAIADIGGEGEVHGTLADVSRPADVRRVFEEVDSRLGDLDILVDNAAVSGPDFMESTLEELDSLVRTNVSGYLMCAREAVSRMRDRGRGHLVLVGSMSADLREAGGSAYVASKGGVQAFAESLRKTVNEMGIRVSLIEPGKVATDMIDASDADKRHRIAADEMLPPEDVAAAIHFALTLPERCDLVSMQLRPRLQVI
jgi:NAD(P)-dependent dehydrogenase (short-subunit alcohol dehydrogenase family)